MLRNGKRKKSTRRRGADYQDYVHTGPDTLAGRFMRAFWQPVYRSQDLQLGEAKPIQIMSEDFTLYRGGGGLPHVVGFRCAHRGTQLSVGWVEEDCIRCMYHGWKYDATGQCIEQPAEDPAYARKIRIRSCPTKEYLGLIFAYFGDGEPPPLPRYPHFEKEGILEASPPAFRSCNYFQCLENHGDVVHVPFVHRESHLLGDARAGIPTLLARQSEWGWTSDVVFPGGEKHVYQFGMPNLHELRLPTSDPEALWEDRLIITLPTNDEHCVRFSVSLVPLTGEAAQRYRERRATLRSKGGPTVNELGDATLAGNVRIQDLPKLARKNILVNTQDYIAQVGQGPITDRTREHLGRSDVGVILLRKMWRQELQALAKGRPLKHWHHPENLEVVYEEGHSPVVGH